ncbi:hypothetical protein DFH09DRAFT_1100161 [Mycena vulgaris]|nr:hypothetical protein DFH09DRAFT_1100161 [Mycena vulgaris]
MGPIRNALLGVDCQWLREMMPASRLEAGSLCLNPCAVHRTSRWLVHAGKLAEMPEEISPLSQLEPSQTFNAKSNRDQSAYRHFGIGALAQIARDIGVAEMWGLSSGCRWFENSSKMRIKSLPTDVLPEGLRARDSDAHRPFNSRDTLSSRHLHDEQNYQNATRRKAASEPRLGGDSNADLDFVGRTQRGVK